MSVQEAQEKISSREFAEWMALYSFAPFGEYREDVRFAQLCQIVVGIAADKGKPPTLDHFMVEHLFSGRTKETVRRQTPAQMMSVLMQASRAHEEVTGEPIKMIGGPNGSNLNP